MYLCIKEILRIVVVQNAGKYLDPLEVKTPLLYAALDGPQLLIVDKY